MSNIVRITSDEDQGSFVELHRDDQGDIYLVAINEVMVSTVTLRLCGAGGGSKCPLAVRLALGNLIDTATDKGLTRECGSALGLSGRTRIDKSWKSFNDQLPDIGICIRIYELVCPHDSGLGHLTTKQDGVEGVRFYHGTSRIMDLPKTWHWRYYHDEHYLSR